jgi:alanyl-tRNA synthetase
VGPTHLRFDFPNTKAVDRPTLQKIEDRVNQLIQSNDAVCTENTSLDSAKAAGVTALFGEKYGDDVRVVHIGGESHELCGGTHLENSAEALAFVIQSEGSVASGIRRIEAITGSAALQSLFENRQQIKDSCQSLQALPEELNSRIKNLQQEQLNLRKEVGRLKESLVMAELQEKLKNLPQVGDVPYLAEILPDLDAGDLRGASEKIRASYPDLPILLATQGHQKAAVLISFPKAWVKEKGVHAGKSLKPLGKHIQGGGGGAPDLAQAGGKNPDGLPEVLKGFKQILEDLN